MSSLAVRQIWAT